jgi:hypothetical protein
MSSVFTAMPENIFPPYINGIQKLKPLHVIELLFILFRMSALQRFHYLSSWSPPRADEGYHGGVAQIPPL